MQSTSTVTCTKNFRSRRARIRIVTRIRLIFFYGEATARYEFRGVCRITCEIMETDEDRGTNRVVRDEITKTPTSRPPSGRN